MAQSRARRRLLRRRAAFPRHQTDVPGGRCGAPRSFPARAGWPACVRLAGPPAASAADRFRRRHSWRHAASVTAGACRTLLAYECAAAPTASWSAHVSDDTEHGRGTPAWPWGVPRLGGHVCRLRHPTVPGHQWALWQLDRAAPDQLAGELDQGNQAGDFRGNLAPDGTGTCGCGTIADIPTYRSGMARRRSPLMYGRCGQPRFRWLYAGRFFAQAGTAVTTASASGRSNRSPTRRLAVGF